MTLDRYRPAFEPMVFLGSDLRLQSQYGTRQADGLHLSDIPCAGHRILYGPHIALPAGRFRFELKFEMQARGDDMVSIDLTCSGGRREFYLRRCFDWELHRGLIRISYSFSEPTDAFELRLYAGTGFEITVKELVITTIH